MLQRDTVGATPERGVLPPRLRGLLATSAALAARNRLLAVAVAVGALLRVLAMIGYPGAIWFPGDSYLYLGAALRPRPDLSKTVGYAFFLRALEPLHSLTLVVAVQHVMGIAMAVLVYLLTRRARLPRWAATLCALPVLLDGYEIQLEHMVMSDTLFAFLLVVAVTLLMWRDRPPPWVALAAGLAAGYAAVVREAGLPALAVLVAYFLIRWRGWLIPLALAAACMAPVVSYAAWFHSVNGQYTLTRATGFYLWGRVSSFADCAQIKPPAAERRLCPSQPPSRRQPPGQYVWINPTVHRLPGGPVSVANNKLLTDFAVRAIAAQPFGYLHAIADGLTLAVDWHRIAYPGRYTANHYFFPYRARALPANHSWIPGGTAASDARAYGHANPSRVVRPFSLLMEAYQRVFYTWGPLLGAMLLAGLAGLARRWRRLGGAGLLPWAVALTLLLFPIATADFDYRYLLAVLPFASLACGLAFAPDVRAHDTLTSWRPTQLIEDRLPSRERPTRSGASS